MRTLLEKYGLVPGLGVAVFDPMTLTVASLASTAAGGAISAAGTIAGGNYALQAGQMTKAADYAQAQQLDDNAAQAFASGQRTMLDTQQKTRLAIATSTARAAASGVDAGTGSPVNNVGALAQRGSYQALMDMFNGSSQATGLRNQATSVRYSGDLAEIEGKEKKSASELAAIGTLAGTAGNMMSTYGKFAYPTSSGKFGA